MKTYKVVIETLFVRLPGEPDMFGFFSTYFIESGSATAAARKAGRMAREVISGLGVEQVARGAFAPSVCIKDIWEMQGAPALQTNSNGATFYRMGPLAIAHAIIRIVWMRVFSSHLVV